MDGNQLADSDHCDCNAGATVTIKVLSGWLDAPTCEGWWWYEPAGSGLEVVQVALHGESFSVLRAGCEADYGFPAYILSELPAGRWFGPLVPPS